jgi:hypothetical protein
VAQLPSLAHLGRPSRPLSPSLPSPPRSAQHPLFPPARPTAPAPPSWARARRAAQLRAAAKPTRASPAARGSPASATPQPRPHVQACVARTQRVDACRRRYSLGPRVKEPTRTVLLPEPAARNSSTTTGHDAPKSAENLRTSPSFSLRFRRFAEPPPEQRLARSAVVVAVRARRTRCAAPRWVSPPRRRRSHVPPERRRSSAEVSSPPFSLPHSSPLDVLLARHGQSSAEPARTPRSSPSRRSVGRAPQPSRRLAGQPLRNARPARPAAPRALVRRAGAAVA